MWVAHRRQQLATNAAEETVPGTDGGEGGFVLPSGMPMNVHRMLARTMFGRSQ
jgi:hypothetical protein